MQSLVHSDKHFENLFGVFHLFTSSCFAHDFHWQDLNADESPTVVNAQYCFMMAMMPLTQPS